MPSALAATFLALVVSVHDGDTMRVQPATGPTISVRIGGIDAPELHQAYGRVSGKSLRTICLGKQARITPETADRYGRLVARVRCGRTDASHYQVERGMAWVFTRYEPASSSLYHWQARAQLHQRGLWREPTPMSPWQYRSIGKNISR